MADPALPLQECSFQLLCPAQANVLQIAHMARSRVLVEVGITGVQGDAEVWHSVVFRMHTYSVV